MRVFSVCGISGSGKTTTIEFVIKELVNRGYKVGSIKEIHNESFHMDTIGSNTNRHKNAGSSLVCARGLYETDMLFPGKLPMRKILSFYEDDFDFVVIEGKTELFVPTILTAHSDADANEKWDDMVFCVSGRISSETKIFKGLPAIDATTNIKTLVDLIERKAYKLLPDFPEKCCTACGYSCKTLGKAILAGTKNRNDCVADKNIELLCEGKQINMVPFVQKILKNAILGVVSELDGYKDGDKVEIKF